MKTKTKDYRYGGLDKIPAEKKPTEKAPAVTKRTAKRDLRVKGG